MPIPAITMPISAITMPISAITMPIFAIRMFRSSRSRSRDFRSSESWTSGASLPPCAEPIMGVGERGCSAIVREAEGPEYSGRHSTRVKPRKSTHWAASGQSSASGFPPTLRASASATAMVRAASSGGRTTISAPFARGMDSVVLSSVIAKVEDDMWASVRSPLKLPRTGRNCAQVTRSQ